LRNRFADFSSLRRVLGLPDGITAALFDLDGVLTDTAAVHERAWKQTFDAYLPTGSFESADYNRYVDGKPRDDGIRDFLASRDLHPSDADVEALSTTKNDLVLKLIHEQGVKRYDGSARYLQAVRDAGLRRALVSSSHNAEEVLEVTGLAAYIEVRIDGHVSDELKLRGKPAPDTFLEAARRLGVAPAQAAVFEDAQSGVAAGRAGRFGRVIGVDRVGQREALLEHGADVVVDDLAELL
jgi:beta-phosphoglucomutase family hydrolase